MNWVQVIAILNLIRGLLEFVALILLNIFLVYGIKGIKHYLKKNNE